MPELIKWIIENIDSGDVPADEGNTEALHYNLIQLALYGKPYKRYDYTQDDELEELYKKYAPEWAKKRDEFYREQGWK